MVLAHTPEDEHARLAELKSFGVLDSAPDPAFDEVVDLLAQMLDMPVALVSLLDERRQWFRARHGIELAETPVDQAICSHAIMSDELLEIEDTLADPRSAENPFCCGVLGEMRYYAGVPLITRAGHRIGTLCVLDHKPRKLTSPQRQLLTVMARQVMRQLDLQRALRNKEVLREEIDHRVKNSLQTVASTIRLYRARIDSPEAKEALNAVERRVDAIAQLHAELNLTSKMHHVQIDSYLERVSLLLQRHVPQGMRIRSEAAPMEVDSRIAAALGVIANEFVANAAKYARPAEGSAVEIRFEMLSSGPGQVLFLCRDNGAARPSDPAADMLGSTALGARLMEAAAAQAGGRLTHGREDDGYVLRAELPLDPGAELSPSEAPVTPQPASGGAPAAG
ncbi:sensor histidine kinase [Salipiger abyssi]|uniref:sensor histidine kinase n=1 Tax=Salipiger abyssi TaxID=1250539 RepID=UPI00405892A5